MSNNDHLRLVDDQPDPDRDDDQTDDLLDELARKRSVGNTAGQPTDSASDPDSEGGRIIDFTEALKHPEMRADVIALRAELDPEVEERLKARFTLIGQQLVQMHADGVPDRKLTREEVLEMSGGDDPVKTLKDQERRGRLRLVASSIKKRLGRRRAKKL